MTKLIAILCVITAVIAGCNSEFSPLVAGEAWVAGNRSSISLLKFPSDQNQRTMKASYPSGSSLNDQPCALQTFSEPEIERFKAIIGIRP